MTRDNPKKLRNKKILTCPPLLLGHKICYMYFKRVTVTHLAISEIKAKMLQHFHCITIKDLMFSQLLYSTNGS